MIRFPRLKITPQIKITETILHHTYNSLVQKRNYHDLRNFYDVYTAKRTRANAKTKFVLLAEKLLQLGILPQLYLKVMSNYGVKNARYLHHPTFLASEKALEIFEWLEKKERKKYPSKESFNRNIVIGGSRDEEEILSSVRFSAKYANELSPLLLFVQRDSLSNWYLAVRPDFLEDEAFDMCEAERKRIVKQCLKQLKSERLYGKARRIARGKEECQF